MEFTARELKELHEQVARIGERLLAVEQEAESERGGFADPAGVQLALERFAPLWEQMNTWEQESFIRTLVEEVRYDGRNGAVTVAFRSMGIKEMCQVISMEER